MREGEILYQGERIDTLWPHEIVRKGIIQVPEEGGTFPNLTIEENLNISCINKKAKSHFEANRDMVYDMFAPLKEKRHMMADSLSGGQRKMLSIGKAIMGEPEILLLDLYRQLKELVNHLKKPVLVVEQIMEIALQFADYGHVVQQGRIVLSGTSEELLNSEEVKRSYIGG